MDIIKGRLGGAKKVVIYGPEGVGKSTFASQFPEPVFIDTEGSTKDMDVSRFKPASSWAMLLQQVRYVIDHPECCRTLVIDTADWAEQIEIASLCEEKGWSGLEDPGYGKGYTYSAEKFGAFLNLLGEVVDKGINVVMTAHAQLRKVELPEEMGAYDHWEMKTSKKVAPMIREWADAVFFANYKTRIIEVDKKKKAQGGMRVMYTNHTPFWDAKNRYGLPDEVPFGYDSIRHVIEGQATSAPAEEYKSENIQASAAPEKSKSSKKPEEKKTSKGTVAPDVTKAEQKTETFMGRQVDPDKRIPKNLRDLMIAGDVDEFDLQTCVAARQPGVFPENMPVRDYPSDFIEGWILPNWEHILKFINELKKVEVPFS